VCISVDGGSIQARRATSHDQSAQDAIENVSLSLFDVWGTLISFEA
jgi:hypothetical protein